MDVPNVCTKDITRSKNFKIIYILSTSHRQHIFCPGLVNSCCFCSVHWVYASIEYCNSNYRQEFVFHFDVFHQLVDAFLCRAARPFSVLHEHVCTTFAPGWGHATVSLGAGRARAAALSLALDHARQQQHGGQCGWGESNTQSQQ